MQHAFIMQPLEQVKAWKDTTYFLMLACVQRGHRVCYLDQQSLWLQHAELFADVTWLQVNSEPERPFDCIEQARLPLAQMDVVWVRTDPPFDRRYLYTTLLLDYLPPSTRVVNRPSGIRNWNEKLAALQCPELTPPTCVTCRVETLKAFAEQHGRITLKPLDGFGGRGISFYQPGDAEAVLHRATEAQTHWLVAQAYLPAAHAGDKRILLLNGEVLGGILRVHAPDAELNNLDAGGRAHPLQLNPQDRAICTALKPKLLEQGIYFAGIDVIGDKLIEVNVTSPTGLQELSRFEQADLHHRVVAALENL